MATTRIPPGGRTRVPQDRGATSNWVVRGRGSGEGRVRKPVVVMYAPITLN